MLYKNLKERMELQEPIVCYSEEKTLELKMLIVRSSCTFCYNSFNVCELYKPRNFLGGKPLATFKEIPTFIHGYHCDYLNKHERIQLRKAIVNLIFCPETEDEKVVDEWYDKIFPTNWFKQMVLQFKLKVKGL